MNGLPGGFSERTDWQHAGEWMGYRVGLVSELTGRHVARWVGRRVGLWSDWQACRRVGESAGWSVAELTGRHVGEWVGRRVSQWPN